jgi:hypothetical protein
MTRIKEPKIGITEVPEYKSPLKRIVKSLRKGYDNVREKVAKHSDTIQDLRGQLRDTQKSRAKEAEAELAAFNKKNANRELQDVKKKNLSKS